MPLALTVKPEDVLKGKNNLYGLVTAPMSLIGSDVKEGDLVLIIGSKNYRSAIIGEFSRYSTDKNFFESPFKIILSEKTPVTIRVETTHTPNYDSQIPVRAHTIVYEDIDLIEETLYRIGDYEKIAPIIASEIEKARHEVSNSRRK